MKTIKPTKRFISLLLTICMVLGLLGMVPVPVAQAVEITQPDHGDVIYENDFSGASPLNGWTSNAAFQVQDGALIGTNMSGGSQLLRRI